MDYGEIYPSIGYVPDMLWCGFGIGLLTKIADFKETKEQTAEPLEMRVAREKEFYSGLKNKFPAKEDFHKDISKNSWSACKNFSKLVDEIYFSVDGTRTVINSKASNLCPSLALELDGSFLSMHLHNAEFPSLAIPMWMYGLSALKTVYRSYGIEEGFLPTIKFKGKDFVFEVPFLKQRISEKKQESLKAKINSCIERFHYKFKYDLAMPYETFSVNGARARVVPYQTNNASHKFVGKVSYNSGNYIKRNSTAAYLFILAALQAEESYQTIDTII